MSLVANYSDSSDDENDMEQEQPAVVKNNKPSATVQAEDDEDIFEPVTDNQPGLFAQLPDTQQPSTSKALNYTDEKEEMESIPKPSKAESEIASAVLKNKKNNTKKKIKIAIPSLASLKDDQDEDFSEPRRKKLAFDPNGSERKTSLFSMLPAPKRQVKDDPKRPVMVPPTVQRKVQKAEANLKKAQSRDVSQDSDSEDEDNDVEFFSFEQEKITPEATSKFLHEPKPSSIVTKSVDATPQPQALPEDVPEAGPQKPPPEVFAGAGPAYPEVDDLMANSDALERLAGKHGAHQIKEMDVIEVKGADLAGDTREWLTKALTQEDEDKPGPRCNVKGQTKRKHQITYLAALAKENEHKLKEQWARNAANRKASGAKYGFY